MYNKAINKLEQNLKKIYKQSQKDKLNLPQARKQGLSQAYKQFEKDLAQAVKKEQKKLQKEMKKHYLDKYVDKTGVKRKPQKQAEQASKYPWSGMNHEQRMIKNAKEFNYQVKQMINRSFKGGGRYGYVVTNLNTVFDKYSDRHNQLVRTELWHMDLQGELDGMIKNGVEYVQYVSAGDNRVCPECQALEDYNEGVYHILDAPTLPRHPRCRCILIEK